MTTLRHLSVAICAVLSLSSCGGMFEHVDSRNPTIAQQDALDVSWGLAPRKSRGNPKLRYQYDARNDYAAPAAAAPAEAAPAAAASAPPVQIDPTPPVQTQKAIPANLR